MYVKVPVCVRSQEARMAKTDQRTEKIAYIPASLRKARKWHIKSWEIKAH